MMRYKIRKGSKIGYKKARVAKTNTEVVVVLEIPATATVVKPEYSRHSKCRATMAKVLRIEYLNGSTVRRSTKIVSDYNSNFRYRVGRTIKPHAFDYDRFRECGAGINFFETKTQARVYDWM